MIYYDFSSLGGWGASAISSFKLRRFIAHFITPASALLVSSLDFLDCFVVSLFGSLVRESRLNPLD